MPSPPVTRFSVWSAPGLRLETSTSCRTKCWLRETSAVFEASGWCRSTTVKSMIVSKYWVCGIFTALVNHENPILLELLEGLLGVFLCVVSTVIWISWLVRIFSVTLRARHLLIKIMPLRKTSDVAWDFWMIVTRLCALGPVSSRPSSGFSGWSGLVSASLLARRYRSRCWH